jgi:hypothetical protein
MQFQLQLANASWESVYTDNDAKNKFKILNKVIQHANRQHYNRLVAKSDKIKTTWNKIKQETGKIHVTEQTSSLLINNEKIKGPENVADVFNSFCLSTAENLNLHQWGKKIQFLFQRCIYLQMP